jgi:hypothetical protein
MPAVHCQFRENYQYFELILLLYIDYYLELINFLKIITQLLKY